MSLEVLATTAGVAVLMGVLPRSLFALRLGRIEGLGQGGATGLMLLAGGLAAYGAWAGHVPTVVANIAAVGVCASFLVLHERCQDIQEERAAIAARMHTVRPTRRLKARL